MVCYSYIACILCKLCEGRSVPQVVPRRVMDQVGTAASYGLDGPGTEYRQVQETFLTQIEIHACSGTNPVSYSKGTWVFTLGEAAGE